MTSPRDNVAVENCNERRIELLTRIAEALDTPVGELLNKSTDGPPARQTSQLLDLWQNLRNEADRQYLLGEAQRLLERAVADGGHSGS